MNYEKIHRLDDLKAVGVPNDAAAIEDAIMGLLLTSSAVHQTSLAANTAFINLLTTKEGFWALTDVTGRNPEPIIGVDNSVRKRSNQPFTTLVNQELANYQTQPDLTL